MGPSQSPSGGLWSTGLTWSPRLSQQHICFTEEAAERRLRHCRHVGAAAGWWGCAQVFLWLSHPGRPLGLGCVLTSLFESQARMSLQRPLPHGSVGLCPGVPSVPHQGRLSRLGGHSPRPASCGLWVNVPSPPTSPLPVPPLGSEWNLASVENQHSPVLREKPVAGTPPVWPNRLPGTLPASVSPPLGLAEPGDFLTRDGYSKRWDPFRDQVMRGRLTDGRALTSSSSEARCQAGSCPGGSGSGRAGRMADSLHAALKRPRIRDPPLILDLQVL